MYIDIGLIITCLLITLLSILPNIYMNCFSLNSSLFGSFIVCASIFYLRYEEQQGSFKISRYILLLLAIVATIIMGVSFYIKYHYIDYVYLLINLLAAIMMIFIYDIRSIFTLKK